MSTLFGGNQASKPAGGGLFGNLGAGANNAPSNTSAAPTPSLFPAPQTSQSTAPFTIPTFTLAKPAEDKPAASTFGTGNAAPAFSTGGGASLFGRTTTAAPSGAGQAASPFTLGASNTSTNAGTTGAQPATTKPLFGGLGATTQPQQTGGPVFGGAQATTRPQETGGMFGSATQPTAQAPQAGGLFGRIGQANGTSSSMQQTLAGTGQTNGTAFSAQQTLVGTQSQVQPDGKQFSYFDQLLERGRKRQTPDNNDYARGDLPSLQLGLGDIARKVRNLGQGGPSDQERKSGQDTRSHYLLAASGVQTGAALRDLRTLGAEAAEYAPPTAQASFSDTDLDGYVENLYQQSSMDLVGQALSQAKKDFDDFLEEHVQMEWDSTRRRIYEHFGLVKQGEEVPNASHGNSASVATRGAFGRSSRRGRLGASAAGLAASGLSKSVLGTPSMRGSRPPGFNDVAEKASTAYLQPAPEDRILRDKQDRYAEKIKSLNVSRLEETVYPLLHQLAEIESQPSVEDTSHFVNAYSALVEIVGEKAGVQNLSEPGVVKERRFAQDYLDDSPTSRRGFELRKRILDGSRTFLEKQFLSTLETAVAKNPREANLGGVPTITNKVRGYVRLKAARKELGADNVELQMLNDDYVWVLIFYLLRAGLVAEAAVYVEENERAIKSMDRSFPPYLATYAASEDRRLSPEQQSRISAEYAQRTRIAPENSLDPYRMACFKIIGRCGLSKRSLDGVSMNMEDWLWLQFALAREVKRVEETAAESYGLDDVRSTFDEIGQRHFAASTGEGANAYGTYFWMQILAGQFEKAVAWLYPQNYLTAVHFAVALDYYGLLRVNDFNGSDDLLSYTTRQQPQISFGHMIGYYTRDFRAAKPTTAADYLILICLNKDEAGESGKRQKELCHEALRELVLETREFAQLLGDIRNDGQRIKGAIEARVKLIGIDNEKHFLRDITMRAAQIADDNGRVTDAVLLYHLAEEYDNVISVCSRALSDAISVEAGDAPLTLEPLRPRTTTDRISDQQQQAPPQPGSSLSLTSVTDPAALAANMVNLYKSNALLYQKVETRNRGQIELLLRVAQAKQHHDTRSWPQCIDAVAGTNILPISAAGRMDVIRDRAQSFDAYPPLVARCVGPLLVWTIRSAGAQKRALEGEGWGPEKKEVVERLGQVARDVMVFAGLVKYRLSGRVWDVLAGSGEGEA